MNIIQDKLGNEYLRSNGSMDSNFGPGMIMFSHLPPVTSFTRLAGPFRHAGPSTARNDLEEGAWLAWLQHGQPGCGRMGCAGVGDYVHAMGIKQEKLSEHDYRLPVYPGGLGKEHRAAGGDSQ